MRSDDIAIRPATDQDSGGLASLIALCWSAYPGCILDIAGEEPILRAPATGFQAKGGRLWVACKGDWVIGSVGVVPGPVSSGSDQATAELLKLYVHPALRRYGLARRLVSLAEVEAGRIGAARLELWSDSRFVEAHAFYTALGYETSHQSRQLNDVSNTIEYHFSKLLSC